MYNFVLHFYPSMSVSTSYSFCGYSNFKPPRRHFSTFASIFHISPLPICRRSICPYGLPPAPLSPCCLVFNLCLLRNDPTSPSLYQNWNANCRSDAYCQSQGSPPAQHKGKRKQGLGEGFGLQVFSSLHVKYTKRV